MKENYLNSREGKKRGCLKKKRRNERGRKKDQGKISRLTIVHWGLEAKNVQLENRKKEAKPCGGRSR